MNPLAPSTNPIQTLSLEVIKDWAPYLMNLSLHVLTQINVPQYPKKDIDFYKYHRRFMEYLRAVKLIDILNGKSIRVPDAAKDASEEEKELIKWRQSVYDEKNSIVFTILFKSFDENFAGTAHIEPVTPGDGYTAWKNLCAYIDRRDPFGDSTGGKIAFYTSAQAAHENVSEYAYRLRVTGTQHDIPEEDIIHKLCSGFRDPSKDQCVKFLAEFNLCSSACFEVILARIEESIASLPQNALKSRRLTGKKYRRNRKRKFRQEETGW